MPKFCVNKNAQSTGEHEVHNLEAGCDFLPDPQNRHQLGTFTSCSGAIAETKNVYSNVDRCAYCAPNCHTR